MTTPKPEPTMNSIAPTQPRADRREERAAYTYHLPVMVAEVLDVLQPSAGKLIVDGTAGGGGHSRALLDAGAKIIALDRDLGAITYCTQHLVGYDGGQVQVLRSNYRDLGRVLDNLGVEKIDGILLDLGTSSRQLDAPERGFSFQKEGPLDMRMDQSTGTSAADLVNHSAPEELIRMFRLYGEEPAAPRITAAIVKARQDGPIQDTLALAGLIERVVPKHGPRHPATRVFQALRIAVNDELGALEAGLAVVPTRLRKGGRLAVITFHSLEDRIVKNFCRDTSRPTIDRPEWPQPRPNPRFAFNLLTRRALQASPEEQRRNPRSRSAKLRAVERI